MSALDATIIAMAKQRICAPAIAAQTGVARSTVYGVINRARRMGEDIPALSRRGKKGKRSVPMSPALRDALAPHAARRGLSPAELAETILRQVAGECLVDAVLDDGASHD